jgi:hypothetical protein
MVLIGLTQFLYIYLITSFRIPLYADYNTVLKQSTETLNFIQSLTLIALQSRIHILIHGKLVHIPNLTDYFLFKGISRLHTKKLL